MWKRAQKSRPPEVTEKLRGEINHAEPGAVTK